MAEEVKEIVVCCDICKTELIRTKDPSLCARGTLVCEKCGWVQEVRVGEAR